MYWILFRKDAEQTSMQETKIGNTLPVVYFLAKILKRNIWKASDCWIKGFFKIIQWRKKTYEYSGGVVDLYSEYRDQIVNENMSQFSFVPSSEWRDIGWIKARLNPSMLTIRGHLQLPFEWHFLRLIQCR
jgi:hypothetical protein